MAQTGCCSTRRRDRYASARCAHPWNLPPLPLDVALHREVLVFLALAASVVASSSLWSTPGAFSRQLGCPRKRRFFQWTPPAITSWQGARNMLLPTDTAKPIFASTILDTAGLG